MKPIMKMGLVGCGVLQLGETVPKSTVLNLDQLESESKGFNPFSKSHIT